MLHMSRDSQVCMALGGRHIDAGRFRKCAKQLPLKPAQSMLLWFFWEGAMMYLSTILQ